MTEWFVECDDGIPRPCFNRDKEWALRYIPEDEYVGGDEDVGAYIMAGDAVFHRGDQTSFAVPESPADCWVRLAQSFTFGMKRCIAVVNESGQAPHPEDANDDALLLADDKLAVSSAVAILASRGDLLVNLQSPVTTIGGGGSYRTEVKFTVDVKGFS